MTLAWCFAVFFVTHVWGHGRMTRPSPRDVGADVGDQEKPIAYQSGVDAFDQAGYTGGSQLERFVCRDYDGDSRVTSIDDDRTYTAGQTIKVRWSLSAAHTGDCTAYLSFDYLAEQSAMRWFRIGNWEDCQGKNYWENDLTIPEWVPTGRYVLRWEWYATHLYPEMEFYAQCSDVQIINPTSDSLFLEL